MMEESGISIDIEVKNFDFTLANMNELMGTLPLAFYYIDKEEDTRENPTNEISFVLKGTILGDTRESLKSDIPSEIYLLGRGCEILKENLDARIKSSEIESNSDVDVVIRGYFVYL